MLVSIDWSSTGGGYCLCVVLQYLSIWDGTPHLETVNLFPGLSPPESVTVEINKATAECVYEKTAVTSFSLPRLNIHPVSLGFWGFLGVFFPPTFATQSSKLTPSKNKQTTKLAKAKGQSKVWKSRSRHIPVCKNIQMHAEPFWFIIY